MKRLLDILLSLLILIIFSPIMLIIIVTLFFTTKNNVFYKQLRLGLNQKPFQMFKFTTMIKGSELMLNRTITIQDDPRVLPFGRFLRSTKLDELPQFYNVLKGEMSLVGPRPLPKTDFYAYSDFVRERIYQSKPGITGIGSIIFRNESELFREKNSDHYDFYKEKVAPYKGALEIWYLNNKTFILDLKLLVLTVFVVFRSDTKLPYRMLKNLPDYSE